MWRKNRITFQDHVKYTHNNIVKTFRVGILQYAERFRDMHGLAKYLPPPLTKGREYDEEYWAVCEKEIFEHEIYVTTRDGITASMQDEMYDKSKDYCPVPNE